MKYEEIFKDNEIIVSQENIFERPDATEHDKRTQHRYRVSIYRDTIEGMCGDILADDSNFPDAKSKVKEMGKRIPELAKHGKKHTAMGVSL